MVLRAENRRLKADLAASQQLQQAQAATLTRQRADMHWLAVAASAIHRQLLNNHVMLAQVLHVQESPRVRQLRREALRAAGRRVRAHLGRMRGFLRDVVSRQPPRNLETLAAYAVAANMLKRLHASVEELQRTAEDNVGGRRR